jgi:hypothetical protein
MSRRCSYPVRATKGEERSLISDRIHGRCRFLGAKPESQQEEQQEEGQKSDQGQDPQLVEVLEEKPENQQEI